MMKVKLQEARAAQSEVIVENYGYVYCGRKPDSLEADYALLDATKAAIEAQTDECPYCLGAGEDLAFRLCKTFKGRGRVAKKEGAE